MKPTISQLLPLLLLPLLIQACAPVVVGGAAVGASMLHDRRDSMRILDDEKTELQILATIGEDQELSEHSSIGVTSYNGTVLLTGQVRDEALRTRITDIAHKQSKTVRVVDETTIGARLSLANDSNDAYLTSRVKLVLFELELPDLDPTRIKVVTENEVVYLMGLVTQEEAAAVVEKARFVRGVERVVKIFEYIQPPAS